MNKVVLKIHKWSTDHWVLNYLVISTPIALFTILQIASKQLKLSDNDGNLYLFPMIVFWATVVISVVYPLVIMWGDRLSIKRKDNGSLLLKRVIESINSVCSKKGNRFIEYIKARNRKDITTPFEEITKPDTQIRLLIDELNICLSGIFNMERDDIGISIMIKLQSDKKWNWLYHINLKSSLNIANIVNNAKSSARQIIDEKTNYIFHRNKKQGELLNQYVADIADSDRDSVGSIICRNIGIESDQQKYLQAVLSITTYGKYICDEDSENDIKEILDYVLSVFDARLKLELSLYYIKNCAEFNLIRAL